MSKSILGDNLISTDAGNGWASAYRVVNGKVKSSGIPHARARVTGDRLRFDLGSQNVIEYADFMGQRYGYGDHLWNLTDSPIDLHQNTARRYGGNMHIFLMLVNMALLGVKSGDDFTVIVPAPPGLLNEVAPQIKQAILAGENGEGDGRWSIKLRADKKPRQYQFSRVVTIPEGAGAFAAYRFDLNGEAVPALDADGHDVLAGRVAVLDLGAGTGDTYTMFNGNLNADAIAHATDARAGVISNILQPMLGEILALVPDAKHLTTAHVDSVLRRYVRLQTSEAADMRVSGKTINVESLIRATCERYAEWIAANKIDPLFASGIDALVEAGGAWLYVENFIRDWYPNRLILSPSMFPHTSKIALFDLNGVGQLAFAATVLRAYQV